MELSKRQSARSWTMNFYAPEVYDRFNSSDALMANKADAEWERASTAYRKHLRSIRLSLNEPAIRCPRRRKLTSLSQNERVLAPKTFREPKSASCFAET